MSLLDRLAPRDEELVGDLVEEYQSGRSRAWFWKQVLATIAVGAVRSARAHPGRTAGAILVGWFLSGLGDYAFARALQSFAGLVTWTRPLELLVPPLVIGSEQLIIGAVVGRLGRRVGPAIALLYAATMFGAASLSFARFLFVTDDLASGEQLFAASQFLATLCVALLAAVTGAVWVTGSSDDRRVGQV
jgi:hypothetical protein